MNYQKIYNQIIDRGRARVLDRGEWHHIIPRSLGGTDDKSNLVHLTPEEHFVVHQLLVRITNFDPRMIKAATMMCRNRMNNKLYGWIRRRLSETQSAAMAGSGNTMFGKRWIANDLEVKLVSESEANREIENGNYILGKKAIRAVCGCLVRQVRNRCSIHNNPSLARLKRHEDFLAKTTAMFEEFINSDVESITQFAKLKNTSQPALTQVWKRYIPNYQKYVQQGKSFKNSLTPHNNDAILLT